jgi:hypothetical protein
MRELMKLVRFLREQGDTVEIKKFEEGDFHLRFMEKGVNVALNSCFDNREEMYEFLCKHGKNSHKFLQSMSTCRVDKLIKKLLDTSVHSSVLLTGDETEGYALEIDKVRYTGSKEELVKTLERFLKEAKLKLKVLKQWEKLVDSETEHVMEYVHLVFNNDDSCSTGYKGAEIRTSKGETATLLKTMRLSENSEVIFLAMYIFVGRRGLLKDLPPMSLLLSKEDSTYTLVVGEEPFEHLTFQGAISILKDMSESESELDDDKLRQAAVALDKAGVDVEVFGNHLKNVYEVTVGDTKRLELSYDEALLWLRKELIEAECERDAKKVPMNTKATHGYKLCAVDEIYPELKELLSDEDKVKFYNQQSLLDSDLVAYFNALQEGLLPKFAWERAKDVEADCKKEVARAYFEGVYSL